MEVQKELTHQEKIKLAKRGHRRTHSNSQFDFRHMSITGTQDIEKNSQVQNVISQTDNSINIQQQQNDNNGKNTEKSNTQYKQNCAPQPQICNKDMKDTLEQQKKKEIQQNREKFNLIVQKSNIPSCNQIEQLLKENKQQQEQTTTQKCENQTKDQNSEKFYIVDEIEPEEIKNVNQFITTHFGKKMRTQSMGQFRDLQEQQSNFINLNHPNKYNKDEDFRRRQQSAQNTLKNIESELDGNLQVIQECQGDLISSMDFQSTQKSFVEFNSTSKKQLKSNQSFIQQQNTSRSIINPLDDIQEQDDNINPICEYEQESIYKDDQQTNSENTFKGQKLIKNNFDYSQVRNNFEPQQFESNNKLNIIDSKNNNKTQQKENKVTINTQEEIEAIQKMQGKKSFIKPTSDKNNQQKAQPSRLEINLAKNQEQKQTQVEGKENKSRVQKTEFQQQKPKILQNNENNSYINPNQPSIISPTNQMFNNQQNQSFLSMSKFNKVSNKSNTSLKKKQSPSLSIPVKGSNYSNQQESSLQSQKENCQNNQPNIILQLQQKKEQLHSSYLEQLLNYQSKNNNTNNKNQHINNANNQQKISNLHTTQIKDFMINNKNNKQNVIQNGKNNFNNSNNTGNQKYLNQNNQIPPNNTINSKEKAEKINLSDENKNSCSLQKSNSFQKEQTFNTLNPNCQMHQQFFVKEFSSENNATNGLNQTTQSSNQGTIQNNNNNYTYNSNNSQPERDNIKLIKKNPYFRKDASENKENLCQNSGQLNQSNSISKEQGQKMQTQINSMENIIRDLQKQVLTLNNTNQQLNEKLNVNNQEKQSLIELSKRQEIQISQLIMGQKTIEQSMTQLWKIFQLSQQASLNPQSQQIKKISNTSQQKQNGSCSPSDIVFTDISPSESPLDTRYIQQVQQQQQQQQNYKNIGNLATNQKLNQCIQNNSNINEKKFFIEKQKMNQQIQQNMKMEDIKKNAALGKPLQFFNTEELIDDHQTNNNLIPNLDQMQMDLAVFIEPNFYFASQKEKSIQIYQKSEKNDNDYQVACSFSVYNDKFYEMEKFTYLKKQYIITFGSDFIQEQRSSYIKVYDVQNVLEQVRDQKQQDQNKYKLENIQCINQILVGKVGNPVENNTCFAISPDFNMVALGLMDGQIMLCKSKHNQNLLKGEMKQEFIQGDTEKNNKINMIKFTKINNKLHMFYANDRKIFVRLEMTRSKKIGEPGGKLLDIAPSGKLMGSQFDDDKTVKIYDPFSSKPDVFEYEGQKLNVLPFKDNYIVLLCVSAKKDKQDFVIYDLVNRYIAYSIEFKNVLFILPHVQNQNQECIYLITKDEKGRKIKRLTEKENAFKMDTFFKKSLFDLAYRFAENAGADQQLLAEISKLNADHYWQKGQHKQAIEHYINTIGYVEPSYVIRKYLELQHIEFLIKYLEQIHKQKQSGQKIADKHHTALLLNCYVKLKLIEKLEQFLKESNFESDLFDIETAIRVCREQNHHNLALQLAERQGKHEDFLQIKIEDLKQYKEAINYIRSKICIEDKIGYILEFGSTLMKEEADECLKLIKNIVHLSIIVHNLNKKASSNTRPPTQEEKMVYEYLNIQEKDYPELRLKTFRKPDDFLHLFVSKPEYLKNYLEFLTNNFTDFPNEKAIYHRLFEYYLEQYHRQNKNDDLIKNQREVKDQSIWELEMKIDVLLNKLQDQENDKKFDKNHLLVLFKMYDYAPGITKLCQKMKLREELMNFYITNNKTAEIIELCEKDGKIETNLWVQALKYFCKSGGDNLKYIPKILTEISNLPKLSPLLVLNILSKHQNINFKEVKSYFIEKLKQDRKDIEDDKTQIDGNLNKTNKLKQEYQKLKTEAKIIQVTKCDDCNNQLEFPTINFMCGHSYCFDCLKTNNEQKQIREISCPLCYPEFQFTLNKKAGYDKQEKVQQNFFAHMNDQDNKFDIITEYLGKGLFKNKE